MQTMAQINARKRKLRELGEQITGEQDFDIAQTKSDADPGPSGLPAEDNKAPLEVAPERLANQIYKENKYYGTGQSSLVSTSTAIFDTDIMSTAGDRRQCRNQRHRRQQHAHTRGHGLQDQQERQGGCEHV